MKYRTIVALIILAALALADESATASERPTFGVKGGLNFAWMNARGAGSKIGFTGGVFAGYRLNSRLTVQPELLFARQGGDFSSYSESWDLSMQSSLTLDYLQVPLLVKYSPPLLRSMGPALYTGPSLFVTLSDNAILETDYGRLDADILNSKGTYWGWVFGGEIDLPTAPARLVIDVRFTLGLQDFLGAERQLVDPETEVNLLDSDGVPLDLKHHSIAVTIGAAF